MLKKILIILAVAGCILLNKIGHDFSHTEAVGDIEGK